MLSENSPTNHSCFFPNRYGDRFPRGFVARIFAIFWVLTGLVIISIFTGVVTTSLTAITLSTDVKLYGTKVGKGPSEVSVCLYHHWPDRRYHQSFSYVL